MINASWEFALDRFAKNVITQAKANLTRKGKNVSSELYDALRYELDFSENSFSLRFYMTDYGDFQDKGVSGQEVKYNSPYSFKQKMPPRQPLKDWIQAKGIRGRDPKSGRFITADSLSFIFQRSIFKKGIRPSLFFTSPFQSQYEQLPNSLAEAFALDVADFIKQTNQRKK
jgi:hypothetical protein